MGKKMTVAELRRRLVPGARLALVRAHFLEAGEVWERTVDCALREGVAFAGDERSKGRRSWLDFPKAARLTRTSGGFIIRDGDGDPRFDLEYAWL